MTDCSFAYTHSHNTTVLDNKSCYWCRARRNKDIFLIYGLHYCESVVSLYCYFWIKCNNYLEYSERLPIATLRRFVAWTCGCKYIVVAKHVFVKVFLSRSGFEHASLMLMYSFIFNDDSSVYNVISNIKVLTSLSTSLLCYWRSFKKYWTCWCSSQLFVKPNSVKGAGVFIEWVRVFTFL